MDVTKNFDANRQEVKAEINKKIDDTKKENQAVLDKEKLVGFFKNNKAATVLIVLLLVVFIWFSIKIRINDKTFNNEKTQLITQYESKIDSLQIKHLEFATEVFSWSVRS